MMEGILCFLLIAGLSGVLADPASKKRASTYCYTPEGTYRHGQVYKTTRNPCVTYRCEYGYERVYQPGCRDARNVCRRPGARFPYYTNGRIYNDCTCHNTYAGIQYTCNP